MATFGTGIKLRSSLADAQATGEALIKEGLLTREQLDICSRQLLSYMDSGQTMYIEQILVHNHFVTREQIAAVIDKSSSGTQSALFKNLLPVSISKRYSVFPLRVQNGVLEIKAAKPLTPAQINSIKSNCIVDVDRVRIIPTDLPDIQAALRAAPDSDDTFDTALLEMKENTVTGVLLRRAMDALLIDAVKMRASDIHLDKKENPDAWISHRVDGKITQSHLLPARIMAALFTRLKTEAGMDASEDRRAQDGRVSLKNQGRLVDFRVATQPVVGGETMTLRVLDPDALIGLERLFPNQPSMSHLFRMISKLEGKHGGIILFSGPTGSGKTTSLYALAREFPRDTINLVSVENPVEYVIPFMRQVQLNNLMDEQSVDVERSMMRQDPDILILGEIRDADTMRAALKFAESGHLVLASIHANNTAQTFERVLSFVDGPSKGEALYMLANTLRVVVSQRLTKSLCTCAVTSSNIPQDVDDAVKYKIHLGSHQHLKHAKGCPRCQHSGYYGRVAVHETLIIPMDDSLRTRLTTLLAESSQNFALVKDLPGVVLKTRSDTVSCLLEAGIIDVKTAIHASNQELL